MACGDQKAIIDFASKAQIKCEIHTKSLVKDSIGGQTNEWISDGKFYCYMAPYRGSKETYANSLIQSKLFSSIFIRYRPAYANTKDFSSKRVVYKGRIFNIAFIRNLDATMKIEGQIFHEIFVEENAPEFDNG